MPPKTKKGKGGRRTDDSDSDTTTVARHSDDEEEESTEGLESFVDQLTEKRAATRDAALKGICKLMRSDVIAEDLQHCAETLVDSLLTLIKKGGSKEGSFAATTLAMAFITLGEDFNNVIDDSISALGVQLKSNKHVPIRASVADAIGIGAFISGRKDAETFEVMERLSKYFTAEKDVVVACLRAWGLLASSISDSNLVARMDSLLDITQTQVEHSDVEVRMMAAENIALLYEACWRHGGDAAERFCGTEGDADEGSMVVRSEEDKETNDLGGQSVKKTAKAERVKERILMRNALKTVETGSTAPVEKLKVRGAAITISTWRDKKRLAALRAVLQGGMQTHLVSNELMHELFDFEVKGGGAIGEDHMSTTAEKKMAHNKQAGYDKARDKVVNKKRADKERGLAQEELLCE